MNDIERAVASLKHLYNDGSTNKNDFSKLRRLDIELGGSNHHVANSNHYVANSDDHVANSNDHVSDNANPTVPDKPTGGNVSHMRPNLTRKASRVDVTEKPIPTVDGQISRSHTLPIAKLRKAGYITPTTRKNRLTEEYRRIKRTLIRNMKSDNTQQSLGNVIAVTSSVSGEGKTFTAINLAMSMALERERTVMLIDADMVRHTSGRIFGVSSSELGLIDLLSEKKLEPSDVILKTNVNGLSFLPAGRSNHFSSELLFSNEMSRLVRELSERYDDRIIILDCPPVLQTNEGAILADQSGQVVFVVAGSQTNQAVVMKGLQQLENSENVNILLNKCSVRNSGYDYYSYLK